MVERFSWQWFDRFWQLVALLITLAVLGFEFFTAGPTCCRLCVSCGSFQSTATSITPTR